MLVCKWDLAGSHTCIGGGRRNALFGNQNHLTDFIHIAEYRVDRETGEVDAVPACLAVFNRWTGRVILEVQFKGQQAFVLGAYWESYMFGFGSWSR